jgi:hypothetical protein
VVSGQFLLRFPDPLCDDLTDTGTAVIESSSNAHGDDRRYVTSHPRTQRARAWERAAGTEKEAAVASSVCAGGQQASCKPADASNRGADSNVPTASIEVVGTPAEEQADEVATYPWWY